MSVKGQSKLKLSGNGNECKPLAEGAIDPCTFQLTPNSTKASDEAASEAGFHARST